MKMLPFFFFLLLVGCSRYEISKEDLVKTMEANDGSMAVGLKFTAQKSDGTKMWLRPSPNTSIVCQMNDGRSEEALISSLTLRPGALMGARPGIFIPPRLIHLDSIEKIRVRLQGGEAEPVKE